MIIHIIIFIIYSNIYIFVALYFIFYFTHIQLIKVIKNYKYKK